MDMMREVLTRSSWLAATTYFLSSNALLNASIESWNWEHRKYHFINDEQPMHCSFSASNATTCIVPLLDGRAPLWQHCFSPAAASALHIRSQPREYSAAPASKCTNAKCAALKATWLQSGFISYTYLVLNTVFKAIHFFGDLINLNHELIGALKTRKEVTVPLVYHVT